MVDAGAYSRYSDIQASTVQYWVNIPYYSHPTGTPLSTTGLGCAEWVHLDTHYGTGMHPVVVVVAVQRILGTSGTVDTHRYYRYSTVLALVG